MPGTYGRLYFTQPTDTVSVKPARSGPCVECGGTVYRETYIAGRGWIWRHTSCDPVRTVVERRTDTRGRPMGYVPAGFDRVAKAERINAGLKAGTLVARRGDGSVNEQFRVRVH